MVRVGVPGDYRVAVRYSPYWHASAGCVAPRTDGMTTLRTAHAGVVSLDFSLNAGRALAVLGGGSGSTCTPAAPLR